MLYNLLYPLSGLFSFLNIFKYITFRAGSAAVTAFVLCLLLGPLFIKKLRKHKIGENVRLEDCPGLHQLHAHKQNTPTMGGILIVVSIFLSVLLWADLTNTYVLLTLAVFVGLGCLGAVDDYRKLHRMPSI